MNSAVFVDFENLYLSLKNRAELTGIRTRELSLQVLDGLLKRLRENGRPMILGRSYAAFDTFPGVEVAHDLALMGLDPQYVLISHTGKNSADVQLALAVSRVVFRRADVSEIVIVSGDRDFIPLAGQVLEEGRELTIVSIPETTSGDLRERVGSERFWNALDLLQSHPARDDGEASPGSGGSALGGQSISADGPVEHTDALVASHEAEAAASGGGDDAPAANIVGHIPVTWETVVKPPAGSDQEALLQQCLELLMRSRMRHSSDDIWLSPFLKGPMSQHFSNLVHPERRGLINELRNRQVIKVEERANMYADHPYSVIVIDDNHSMAQDVWARVRSSVRS